MTKRTDHACPAWCTHTETGHTTHSAHVGGRDDGPEFVLLLQADGGARIFLSTGTGAGRRHATLPLDAVPGVAAALRLGDATVTRELADLLDRAAEIAGGAR